MHIADGILSTDVCVAAGAAAGGALALSWRNLAATARLRTVPLTGMMASLVFSAQMVNFPLFGLPASGHILGGLLAAVMLGPWAGCLALALVLFVQMALFSDGGWLAYGANVLNMGVVGSLGGYVVYASIRRFVGGPRGVLVGSVIAAWVSVLAGASLFCIEFAASHLADGFNMPRVFLLMAAYHSLIGVGEALITGMIVSCVLTQRPELIYAPDDSSASWLGAGRFAGAGLVLALAVAAFLAPFASDAADGLETVAQAAQFDQLAQESSGLNPFGYSVPLPWSGDRAGFWSKASISLAGVLGTLVVFVMAHLFARLFAKPRGAAAEGNHVA